MRTMPTLCNLSYSEEHHPHKVRRADGLWEIIPFDTPLSKWPQRDPDGQIVRGRPTDYWLRGICIDGKDVIDFEIRCHKPFPDFGAEGWEELNEWWRREGGSMERLEVRST